MHITLHLTTHCNLRCNYCYSPPRNTPDMSEDIAKKAVAYVCSNSPLNTGIIFFGGEPLLRKDLIRSTISYCDELKKRFGWQQHFKVTTNGILLDEEFLKYSNDVKLGVALSVDGIRESQDYHRKFPDGTGSFDILESKVELLLKFQPYASFLMVITPETVEYYYESVRYLFQKGVRYIIASINYAGLWTTDSIRVLKKQYILLAKLYEEMTMGQQKFYFSPFEIKFASHIKNENGSCNKCHLGMKQVSVSQDGFIYPCVQFVGRQEYRIGDIWNGIDMTKRKELYDLSLNNSACVECAMEKRCNNRCSCLNLQTTGQITTLSPLVCETEKMLMPIVDRLGNKLFEKKAPSFIQKHYNSVYPILSLIEDSVS